MKKTIKVQVPPSVETRRINAKRKGSSFERAVCDKLSAWITGTKKKVLTRNITSGARFTHGHRNREGELHGSPGDLMAMDPAGEAFIQMFSVECKHRHKLDIGVWLRDKHGTSFLAQTINSTMAQANLVSRRWMLIAKEDMKEPLVIVDRVIGFTIVSLLQDSGFTYHVVHSGRYYIMALDDFLAFMPYDTFMARLRPRIARRAIGAQ